MKPNMTNFILKMLVLYLGGIFLSEVGFGQTYAILAARLIDCKSGLVNNHPVVVVREDKILSINYTNTVPDSAIVIRLDGYTLLPGLMDVHTHILADGGDYDQDLYEHSPAYRALRAVKYLSDALQTGITTVRDVCSEGAGFADVDLSRAVDSGFIAGPRIFPAGPGIAATGRYLPSPSTENWELSLPSGSQNVTGRDECVKAVREQTSRRVRWIKLFADWGRPTFSLEEMKAVVDEANKAGISVAAHASSRQGISWAIQAGVRSIEHGNAFDDSLIQMAVDRQIYWCPTISVFEYFGEPLDSNYKYLNRANKRNVKIVMGTDIGSFPWANNEAKELEYYVRKAGFTPMEAIRTATVNAAELLKQDNKLGRIEKDFIADIIGVKGNPLEDIRLLQDVGFVMKGGKIYKQSQ
jgi:imidazolonepropionase-like amidohydrolase